MERWQRSHVSTVGLTIAILAGYWCVAFALIRVASLARNVVSPQIGEILAGAIAMSVAYALRVRFAVYLLGVFFAFSTAEFAMDMIFGRRAVPGGGAHWALLAAATIGVLLGSNFAMRLQAPRATPQQTT